MSRITLTLCVVLVAASSLGAQEPIDRFEKVANRMVEAINANDYEGIARDFGQVMLDAFPQEKLIPFFKGIESQLGKIRKLDPGRFTPPYTALFPAHYERGILDIKIVLDGQDKIIGLWLLPHTADVPVPEKHETKLALPVEGEWFVFWGGDTKEVNHHHDVPNQRFAFDLLVVDGAGETHKAEGLANEDYFAFGKPVLAPADGVVTEVITGVRDNTPGSMNPYSALGNAVFIEHRQYEVSVLAHFKRGSIKVKVGDKVKRGQLLGMCGNSGNSSEPHLHYHLQNTPIIQEGTGIKCLFDKIVLIREDKRETKSSYSPVKGDIVSPK